MAERRQGPRRGDRGWGVIRSPRYWNSKRGLPVPDSGISKPRHPAKLSNPQEPRTHGAVEETSEETSARHEILQNRPHRRGVYRLSISTGHRHEEKSTAAELGSRGVPERCRLHQRCTPDDVRTAGREIDRARRHPWSAGTAGPYQYCNRSLRYFRLPIVVLCG